MALQLIQQRLRPANCLSEVITGSHVLLLSPPQRAAAASAGAAGRAMDMMVQAAAERAASAKAALAAMKRQLDIATIQLAWTQNEVG